MNVIIPIIISPFVTIDTDLIVTKAMVLSAMTALLSLGIKVLILGNDRFKVIDTITTIIAAICITVLVVTAFYTIITIK